MKRLLLLFLAVSLYLSATSLHAFGGTEPAIDDLLKKRESNATPLTTSVSIPQITHTPPLIPKTEQLKLPVAEKAKITADEQLLSIQKESKDGTPTRPEKNESFRDGTPTRPEKNESFRDGASVRPERIELSRLEKLITADEVVKSAGIGDSNPARSLIQFGYSYFSNVAFAPPLDLPVSPDYLIGPGDSVVVTVWGSIEGTYDLTVSRSGEIILPKIGPVRLAGVQFGKLQDLLKARLARVFRDFDLTVSMGKLRTIKVYVIGEVNAPGDYTVSALSTVLNALGAAGGPTKNGSLRHIKIRRAGNGEETIDLYDFFTRGDKRKDVRLYAGDTIFVPVLGKVAAVAGNVKRPAIYELQNETTLRDLLDLGEGILVTGYLQRVQISRVVANDRKQVLDVSLDPARTGKSLGELAAAIPIQDMDVVRIFPINTLLRDHFRLEGHVERPGFYALKPGMRISSILSRDLLLPEYSPTVVEITRLFPPDLHPEKITVNLEAALALDPAHDLEIKEFDIIRAFARTELEEAPTVRVSGEVQRPGEYSLLKNMTVRDLLIQAGYPKATAYLRSAEISRLKRDTDRVKLQPILVNLEEALKGNPEHNIVLDQFDELNVRKIPNWAEEKERYVTLTGEFVFPGVYPVYRGERLSSLIARAGGFTDKAYLKGARFTREAVKKLQQQRMDEALARAQEETLRKQTAILSAAASKEEIEATKATLEGLERTIQLLKTKKAEGRMIVRIETPDKLKGSSSDIEVAGGDTLNVPSDPASVNILGSVYNPTTALFEPGRDVGYYLKQVGGVTQEGDEGEMYLVKVDGAVFSNKQATAFLFYNSFLSRQIDPGDTIVVPQQIEKTAWLRDIKDVTTILSQVAITAGTVLLGLR